MTCIVPVRLPDIDFARIRPYGQPPSQAAAFEELTSILIEQGVVEWPEGTRFHRFGNPDGGREGKGVLPSGDVWAWQAKYLFEFDASAAGQVTASFRRVLELETNLTRYMVALPLDLPAGDTDKQTSAFTRWSEKVSEWEALARQQGLEVDFVFVGAHQLVEALTEPRHAGRARYWLDAQVLTPDWQSRRLEEVVAQAGRRYTPRLHVEVDTVRALDAVGRVEAYVQRWQQVLAELREARRWSWRAPADVASAYDEALPNCAAALDEADAALVLMIAGTRSTDTLPQVDAALDEAVQALLSIDALLHEHSMTKDRYFVGDAASLYSEVRAALSAVRRGEELARSATTRAAREKVLVLTGRAGVGKTHLLCDVASRRIAERRPTVLLLGQEFDGRSLLPQIGELTGLGGSADDIFAVLDAAAETAGHMGLFMIDALNEVERPERWRDGARALILSAARYPHVGLVLSCRTEFVETVIGDANVPSIEHIGFAEATDVAVRRFTEDFGLEPPTFPVLNPEFSNPLFLKLTCESLATLGATRFPFGAAGLLTLCDAFLEAVNKRLSEPGRGDYDERSDLVRRVAHELALLGEGAIERADVQRITEVALPDRPWSRSLMHGLISEGVLIELSDGRITFGYQRLGDVMRAEAIAGRTLGEIRGWLKELGDKVWRVRGVLGALGVIIPERHGVELIDLATDEDGRVEYDFVDSFLESLLLRAPAAVSPRAIEIVQRLLDDGYQVGEIWDRLIRIACVPGHPLNAEWLHSYLAAYEVADRDVSWSTWLVGSVDFEEETPVRSLMEWAWPSDLQARATVPDDVAVLATQMLGWLLTTSDRRVRDRATKSIVSVGERAPAAFARTLSRFRGTNDPYVIERLTAAACGVLLRSADVDAARHIADSLLELVEDGWPEHLMTRDFVRRVLEVAQGIGWSGPDGRPPYGAAWPIVTRPIEEIEALAGPPDYAYGSIWHSVAGMGDFGSYVLGSSLRHVVCEDEATLRHDAERAVFDRALELGWTPERFAGIDRGRPGGRDGVVERVGKKYQWIGFYEVLGRIVDHHAVKPSYGEEDPRLYQYPEQVVWRDIDPTVLVRKPTAGPPQPPWFSPADAQFPAGTVDEYPADLAGVPDPLELISVSDPEGGSWLVLVSNPDWEQPQPPEVQALHVPRLRVWMQVHAYLVPQGDAAALRKWAKGKNWFGRWMPDTVDVHNVLLGAYPGDPAWSDADGSIEWWDRQGGPQPPNLWECAAWYGGTGTSRDASADGETTGYVPTARLLDLLRLSRGIDFSWTDGFGVAVMDPSVTLGGPGSLVMRRDLVSRLADAGMTIFWTVLIGNELVRRDLMPPGDDYRWVSASGSYVINGDRVEQLGADAIRCRPGPATEYEVEWVTKKAEL
jgi:hypothetical protein